MNIKYEDLQYAGAVHLESGHPHLQVMMWSKQKEKMNYFIKYNVINKMKDEFTNSIFRDDLVGNEDIEHIRLGSTPGGIRVFISKYD